MVLCVCVCVFVVLYKKFHRAVSPTLCDSYSHTVLSRFTIRGVSTDASSSGTPMHIRVREFKCCIAIVDGGGGVCGCGPHICTCGMCRTPAIVPPYEGQCWFGCRGSVHVDDGFGYVFGTGLWNERNSFFVGNIFWMSSFSLFVDVSKNKDLKEVCKFFYNGKFTFTPVVSHLAWVLKVLCTDI